MRVLSTALVFTACSIICTSAADINTPVQLCINDIAVVNSQLVVLKSTIDAFTSRAGYSGWELIQAKQQEVEKRLLKSIASCNYSTSLTYNKNETDAISLTVAKYSINMVATIKSYKKKRFELAAFTSMKHHVVQLANNTVLSKAVLPIIRKTSSEEYSILESYFDQLNNTFQSTKAKYESAMSGTDDEINSYLYECTDQLIDINQRLVAIKTSADTFTFSAAGQPGWSVIGNKLRDTENLIMQCLPSCGRPLQRPYTVDEENELFSMFAHFSTNVCTALTSLENRKLELFAVGQNFQVKTRIKNILDHTHSLNNHVINKVSPTLLPTVERYVGKMVASFQRVLATYSLKSLVIP